MQIQSQLRSLPAPTNEVEICMRELDIEEPPVEAPLEEDAADADKRRERLEQERLAAERAKRSQPVQRGLPRPVAPLLAPAPEEVEDGTASTPAASRAQPQAEGLLFDEMVALMAHDAFRFPMRGARPPKKAPELEEFAEPELRRAEALLAEEAEAFVAAVGGVEMVDSSLQAAMEEDSVNLAYVPRAKRHLDWRMLEKPDRLEAMTHLFKIAEGQLQKDAKRAKKLEEKLDRLLGGHIALARKAAQKAAAHAEERETVVMETEVFETMAAREASSLRSRAEDLEDQVRQEKERNARLQERYKKFKNLARDLDERLQ